MDADAARRFIRNEMEVPYGHHSIRGLGLGKGDSWRVRRIFRLTQASPETGKENPKLAVGAAFRTLENCIADGQKPQTRCSVYGPELA